MAQYFRRTTPSNASIYHAIGDKPAIGERLHPYGMINVMPAVFRPNFDSHGNPRTVDRYGDPLEGTPETLFDYEPPEIDEAFSHYEARHMMPMLMSMAHRDYGALGLPANLSEHSSRIAKKALARGMVHSSVSGNEDAEPVNSSTFAQTQGMLVDPKMPLDSANKAIPKHEVDMARENLRTLLGRERKPHMGQQFDAVEHPQIPGIDW